jgi:hypothetical protein
MWTTSAIAFRQQVRNIDRRLGRCVSSSDFRTRQARCGSSREKFGHDHSDPRAAAKPRNVDALAAEYGVTLKESQ